MLSTKGFRIPAFKSVVVGFLRKDRQRCLEPVREITGLGLRASHSGRLMHEQGVEVVHNWRHLGREVTGHGLRRSIAHGLQLFAQRIER